MKKQNKTIKSERKNSENQLNKSIGIKLKTIRVAHCLSQADMANMLGITHQQFQKYEKGQNSIPLDALTTISNKFNVNIATLFAKEWGIQFLADGSMKIYSDISN